MECVPSMTHNFDYLWWLCLNHRKWHMTKKKRVSATQTGQFSIGGFRAQRKRISSRKLCSGYFGSHICHVQIKTSATINTLSVSL
ncbi:unnamed protein product [Ixodes persulcatus]